ncbi:MAG: hypothetical protein DMF56_02120 [Acidobacteria bacterium]|nr:MAG: hypothetical protein DMF56_02120 [Acidobacteriota bacterium]
MIQLLIKVTLLLLCGFAVAELLRARSAAARHFVWSLTIAATLFATAVAFFASPWIVPIHYKVASAPAPITNLTQETVTRVDSDGAVTLAAPAVPRPPIFAMLWIAGALATLAWFIAGNIGLARIARSATPMDDWQSLVDRKRNARVAYSAAVGAPVTWGWLRPVVLLPADAATWPLDRRRAALLHELAHVARRDSLTQLFASLACAAYWFHPLMWLAVRQLRRESEHASDDRVLAGGIVGPDYAAHLLAVANAAHFRRLAGFLVLGMASHLQTRVEAVLDESRKRTSIPRVIAIAAVIVASIAIIPLARARAELFAEHDNDESVRATFSRTFDAAPGETLDLALEAGGSVVVRGWDQRRVSIEGRILSNSSKGVEADAQRVSDGVRVTSGFAPNVRMRTSSVKFTINVPRQYNVRLHSSGGGLSVSDVEGSFEGTTGGGELEFRNAKGSAHLSTGGGEIRVDDVDMSGSMSTGGGKVWLSRVRGGLSATSGSGPVVNAEDVTTSLDDVTEKDSKFTVGDRFQGRLHITKAGGDIEVRSAPKGVYASTGGGDVRIGSGAGRIEAHTGGGDIDVGPIAGSVDASTGAGKVTISLADANGADQSVSVFTGYGRVIVELPESINALFELETAYTEGYRRKSHIESDWALTTTESDRWDDSEGTPRKYIRGKGTIGSGKSLIKVKAVNGDVIVRRR